MTIICVILHGIWDMYVPVLDDIAIPIFLSLKLVILIVAIWVVLNVLLSRGLSQINDLATEKASDTSEIAAFDDALVE